MHACIHAYYAQARREKEKGKQEVNIDFTRKRVSGLCKCDRKTRPDFFPAIQSSIDIYVSAIGRPEIDSNVRVIRLDGRKIWMGTERERVLKPVSQIWYVIENKSSDSFAC